MLLLQLLLLQLKRTRIPDSQLPDTSGWNSQLNAPYDTLAGATFVWTNPPTIWAVMKGSIAEGQMSKGTSVANWVAKC